MEMKVADVIVKCLEAEGIEYAFGISGSHYLSFLHALKNSSIKYISVKHESAASLMALHYARFAQKPALVLGTAGPGAMNLLTGIAEMYKSCIPCFVLTPVVPTDLQGKCSLQEDSGYANSYSIQKIMSCLTKRSILCVSPQNIQEYCYDLFRYCLHERKGPVHLLVPTNYFEQKIDFTARSPAQYRNSGEKNIDPDKICAVAAAIKNSKKPLLFVGQRAWFPNISRSISELSDKFHIPVILSHGAKGLYDEYSAFFGGILDLYGHRSAELLSRQSDCVVSIGEDFGEFTTIKYEPELFKNKLIQLDVDGYDVGRNYPVLTSAFGDLSSMLGLLCRKLVEFNTPCFYNDDFKTFFNDSNSFSTQEMQDSSIPLKPQRIFKEISDLLPDKASVIVDMGSAGFFTVRNLKVRCGSYSICTGNYTMSQAVAGVIGSRLGNPENICVAVCGDGAFMMNCMEMATARQYNIPIIWIVFVDRRYGNVEWAQRVLYNDLTFCTELFVPDLHKFAEAFSIDYYKIDDTISLHKNFSLALQNYRDKNQSALIEVAYDTEEQLPMKPRMVKFIQDMCNLGDFKTTPYFMKSLKSMLREKV
jgi:acetolactate synthase I/II/III large subunit